MKDTTRDLEMMRHPEEWPHLFLPVKSREHNDPKIPGFPLLGLMFEDSSTGQAEPRVYIGDMYELGTKPITQMESKTYASLEAVVGDGWVVD